MVALFSQPNTKSEGSMLTLLSQSNSNSLASITNCILTLDSIVESRIGILTLKCVAWSSAYLENIFLGTWHIIEHPCILELSG